eukprot:Hpha_TRINITY_DN15341_c1_g2::TRINITY_DN15341_c1_g2_i2::g.90985::m.90985
MSGLMLFTRVHPEIAGPGSEDVLLPVELDTAAAVKDLVAELLRTGAVRRKPDIEFKGERLCPTDLLADVGICPESVVSAIAPPRARSRIACGGRHSLAITPEEGVTCWGDNKHGQCVAPELSGPVVQVSAGMEHSVCLLESGEVVCWGGNRNGECAVPSMSRKVVQVAAGGLHTVALLQGGTVVCWGDDSKGQCTPPSELGNATTNVLQVAAGMKFSVALLSDGSIVTWGFEGIKYHGTHRFVDVSAGGYFCLALQEDGRMTSWGAADRGQCPPEGFGGELSAVSGGYEHGLGITRDGKVVGWGSNDANQLAFPPVNCKTVAVAAGPRHNIALLEDGKILCWGAGCTRGPPLGLQAALAGGAGPGFKPVIPKRRKRLDCCVQ